MRERDIFIKALEQEDLTERAAVLDKACQGDATLRAQVEQLIAEHERQESFILDSPPSELAATVGRTPIEQPGVFIAGRYKLLEEIGEGGMGTVWVAEQIAPVRRKVALKLIKTGMDSKSVLARFEAERQALAVMDHPNIAKVLDGGLTDSGRPYFVMEYVKGIPITEYCDATRLSVSERLQLFAQVCHAVQHTHQKGIIHRDLKPSNILVAPYDDKPVPKVIDFGLAKAMHQSLTDKTLYTAHDLVLGTPLYMSPEQAQLNNIDVDTRSDIYSLGVLLYELLTGSTPLEKQRFKEAAWDEVRRIIREEEPPRPSLRLSSSHTLPSVAAVRHTEPTRLTKLVRGELDWVVMKALEKDRSRRYETATGFAADVLRYLAGEQVLAAPPSARYRVSKFIRRYKGQVIGASLILLTLVAGVVGTTLGLIEAKRQERIAVAEVVKKEAARRKAREAFDTLTSDAIEGWFTREQSLTKEQTDVLRRLLDQYAEFAAEGGDAVDDRKGQVRALVRVGRIQRTLGDRPAAGEALRRAAEMAGTTVSPITADLDGWDLVSVAHNELAILNKGDGAHSEAENHFREALAAQCRITDIDPDGQKARIRSAGLRVSLAGVLFDLRRFDEAEAEHTAAAAVLEKLVAEFPQEAILRENLAVLFYNRARELSIRGRLPEALVLNGRAVALQRLAETEAPGLLMPRKRLVMGLRQQSELLDNAQRPAEAEVIRREAIRVGFSLSESFPSVLEYRIDLATDYWTLSHHLREQGRRDDAAVEAGRGLALMRQLVADFPDNQIARADLMTALIEFSDTMRDTQKFKESEAAARESLDEGDRLAAQGFDLESVRIRQAGAMRALALALEDQGRNEDARTAKKEHLNILTRLAGDHPDRTDYLEKLCLARIDLTKSLIHQRDADEAIEELQAVLPDLDRLPTIDRERLRMAAAFELAKAFGVSGQWAESEEWAGRAVDIASLRLRENPTLVQNRQFLTQSHWHRATARDQLGRFADAAADWGTAAKLADFSMDKAFYRAHCGDSLARSGDTEKAAAEFDAAIDQAEAVLKESDLNGITYYDAAAVFALAAGGLKDPVAVESHAAQSVRLLGRSAALGFLDDPAQVQSLRSAVAYSALYERRDFEQLLSDLGQKVPSVKESASSPGPQK